MKRYRALTAVTASAALFLAMAACSPPEKGDKGGETTSGVKVSEATSAKDFGGMAKLVAAAKKEGELNVIALPPTWANYASDPEGVHREVRHQDQLGAARRQQPGRDQRGQPAEGPSSAPDVFDLGQDVVLANLPMFAPYKVATFDTIGDDFKDADGTWVNDYGGYMSIGYDSSKVPDVTKVSDLLGPDFKGKVALNGNPTEAGAAASGVMMASLANGGSADDISPGVDFFGKLKKAGNFLPVDPTPATIEAKQTPVVIDWDYLNAAETAKLKTWKVVVPTDADPIAGYYNQAVSKDAPHPAAARLWQEFLFSDAGQNLWLAGGARPVRADAMVKAGTIDQGKYDALPKVEGTPVVVTNEQSKKAATVLGETWAKAVG